MSATTLRFNNRVTRVPGAYTKIDASGLDSPPDGSSGRVAIIADSVGGVPYSAITDPSDILRVSSAEELRRALRSGDLKEAANIAFTPCNDAGIAGPESCLLVKVNPDLPSTVTLANGSGDAITLNSRDYGPHTAQIAVSIADGTAQGRRVTVAFEGTTESRDNIGGSALLLLRYTEPPALGWDTMTISVLPASIRALATRTEATLIADLANAPANAVVEVLSSNAADTTQTVIVYGVVGGVPVARRIALNGTTPVADTAVFDANGIYGAELDAACLGTVTVRQSGPTTIFSFTAGQLSRGGVRARAMFVQGALTLVSSGNSTLPIFIAGVNAAGAAVLEVRALTGTTPIATLTTDWRSVTFIGLARLTAAQSLTISATAADTLHSVQNTLVKVRDFFNALQAVVSSTTYGFTATLNTSRVGFDPAELDLTSTPLNADGVDASLLADLTLLIEYFNDESSFVTAEAASGAVGAPSNTVSPVYLSGGTQEVPLMADWQGALDLLRDVEFDTIVVMTGDPAVHAALAEHLNYKSGPGKAECDAFIGIQNAGLTGPPTATEIRAQISAINNHNASVVAETITRFDTNGERRVFAPHFFAALCAGAQAGSPLGQSLTHAQLNVIALGRHSSWNPRDDAETMLEAGLLFGERMPSGIHRLVRNVTSAVGSDNAAFTDGGANRIVNYATRELRRDLEAFVREPGIPVTRPRVEGRALEKLLRFRNEDKILKGFKDLKVDLTLDRAPVSVSMSPALSINFVPISIYLYDQPITG